jgi:hypothetical protein
MNNVKALLSILTFCVFANLTFGQNKNIITLNYGIGGNIMLINGVQKVNGFDNDGTNLIGFRYQRKINEILSFKTGLDYIRSNIMVRAGYHPYEPLAGDHSWDIRLLSLPLILNYNFKKYFFVEGGSNVDLQFGIWDNQPTDTQSGIGFNVGIGTIYNYKHLSLVLNPFLNYHSIIQFEPYDYDRLCEIGVRFGIGFNY